MSQKHNWQQKPFQGVIIKVSSSRVQGQITGATLDPQNRLFAVTLFVQRGGAALCTDVSLADQVANGGNPGPGVPSLGWPERAAEQ